MNIYTIYKAINKINGKVYIGFDSNWPHRKNSHKSYHKKQDTKFYRAIKKYGWDNFEWDVIYQSTDRDYTKYIMENNFILEHNSFNDGYNSTLGGDGTFGISKKGSKVPYNHNGWIGKKHTEETRKKMSESMKGKKHPNLKQSGSKNPYAKKIKTPFGIFSSIKEASEETKIAYHKICKLLKTNPNWSYLF